MNGSSDRDVAIFVEALALPAGERAAFLERACGGDNELRGRVQALLDGHEEVGDFLEHPPHETSTPGRGVKPVGEKPGDLVGRYKLLQQIGEGGCGVVFMAEQREPVHRRVALKIIKPGMDTKSVIARFEAERQALALMDHPNIAKIFDAGATESGRPYFVMELVRGIKITEYCDQHALTTEERLKLFVQVCQAIQHAHQKGIIHRDIKPSNILVTTNLEGVRLPVVIDFGIAKATTNQPLTDKTLFTAFELLIGTPAYMSPEQAELTNAGVDTRTDIYSLGVLLYELLTGSTPFDTGALLMGGLDEIRRVIREQEPIRPSTRLSKLKDADLTTVAQARHSEPPTLIRAVRGDLDWIAMKALEKDRTRRYETANGLALDVQRYLADEPISARPPSRFYKFQKAVQRNKLLFACISVVALVLVVSLILVCASLARERRFSVKSQQVTKFLEDMLNGVGPSVARGRDTTMLLEILDQTAKRVGTEMTNQPEVEAELSSLIGKLYEQIGNYSQAEEMERMALANNRRYFGVKSREAATSLNDLALEFMAQHKLPEAEAADREALAIRRRVLGEENAETATSINDLGAVFRDEGRLAEAEALGREALGIRQRLFRNENMDVADSLRNLSITLGNEDKWAESESLAREVLAIRIHLLTPEHQYVASALQDVAWVMDNRGKLAEAEKLDREALAIRQKLLGPEHPEVAKSLQSLGYITRQQGKLSESYAFLTEALAMQRKLLREDDPETVITLDSLGSTLEAEGKLSEVETVRREVLAMWRKRAGDEDANTMKALGKLAVTLEAESKWPEAEIVRSQALAVWRKRSGSEDPQMLYALRDVGLALEGEGKWPQAEAVWRESLVAWRKRGGIEEQQSMYTLRKLGLALEAERKWPEAEAVHREAWAVSRKKKDGDQDSEAQMDLGRVVRVLANEKKFVEAEQLLGSVLTPEFVKKPSSAELLAARIDLEGRRAQWQEAAADCALAIELQPNEHYRYHTLAGLLAITHDRPAYEQLCKRLLTKFANTANPYVAERMAQDCLLLPNSGVDLGVVDKLADTAVTSGRGEAELPYFQACKAMSNYRLGHYPEAIEWGEKAAKSTLADAQAKAYAVLAMAQWQLGQKDTARTMLATGDALAPSIPTAHGTEDLGDLWVAWLMARISLDEASVLIQPGPTLDRRLNR
jgi:eukaryotic-like serine/threonine-protein kinase